MDIKKIATLPCGEKLTVEYLPHNCIGLSCEDLARLLACAVEIVVNCPARGKHPVRGIITQIGRQKIKIISLKSEKDQFVKLFYICHILEARVIDDSFEVQEVELEEED